MANFLQGISPLLGMIPMAGGILQSAASIGGGLLEKAGAKKQLDEAELKRKQAMALKPRAIQKEQIQELNARKLAQLSGLPAYDLYKNNLNENAALGLRNIRQTAPTGSAALEATSMLGASQDKSLNQLSMADAQARFDLQKDVWSGLGEVGRLKDVQQGITDTNRDNMLNQVEKLYAAGTYNKMLGNKNILAALSKGGGDLLSKAPEMGAIIQAYKEWMRKKDLEKESAMMPELSSRGMGALESTGGADMGMDLTYR